MTDAEFIKALGGPTVVARALGLKVQAVWNWGARETGIPAEHHIPLWALAQEKQIDWTPPKGAGLKLATSEAA